MHKKDKELITADQIITEIDALEGIFLQSRSVFPALDNGLIGKTYFETAPYYKWRGYNISVHTGNQITKGFIEKYSKIGKWLNEAAIIRLYGIMDYYGFIKNIKDYHHIDSWQEVDLLRRMRNVFTKTTLNYQPDDDDNIRLRKELIDYFKLKEEKFSTGEIPTPVDKVIRPIFEGCRRYIAERKQA
jgi:hypothetical protein